MSDEQKSTDSENKANFVMKTICQNRDSPKASDKNPTTESNLFKEIIIMSMPIIVPGTGSRCQAITDIITSVALEQTALSHVLNAEGEKIQKIVADSQSAEEMLAVNKSVESMVNAVARLEMVLQGKLELFGDCLCDECTPHTKP